MNLKNQNLFRFTEKGHLHEMLIGDKWTPVPGCSSVAGCFDSKDWLGYWSAGQALKPLGWIKAEKDGSNTGEILEAANNGLIQTRKFIIGRDGDREFYNAKDWAKFLDKCYRAHAKETKDTAESGSEMHSWLEKYLKFKLGLSIQEAFNLDTFVKTIPIPGKFEQQICKFLSWESINSVKWLASELQVGSLMFQYCGILDFVAKINGRIVLGDFKTSSMFKDTYIPQLVGLKQCVEEMGQKIDDLAVVRLSRDGDFEYHPVEVDFETELMAFLKAKDFYQARNLFKARRKEIFSEPNIAEIGK